MVVTFNKVKINVVRKNLGSHLFQVQAEYRDKFVVASSNDSEMWSGINDQSNKRKHADAKRSAYLLIVTQYDRQYRYAG